MRLYLDTEFNGFGGELISLALVPTDSYTPEFYRVVHWEQPTDPWVAERVIPYLEQPPISRQEAAISLAKYLQGIAFPVILADWPTDFEHLLALLITGPGQMAPAPNFGMEFRRLKDFNPADYSAIPHNALADARALRDRHEWRGAWSVRT